MELNVKRTESFVFYIDEEEDRSSSPDSSASFNLLANEREICDPCKRVILYRPFCNNRHGILGTLHCTTFRLVFVPIGETEIDVKPFVIGKFSQNLRYETPLLNVHSVVYTLNADHKKFKLLHEYLAHADQVAIVKIFCKDFRVFVFDFKIASEGYRMLLNGLIMKAYPKALSNIVSLAIDASPTPAPNESNNDWRFPTFNEAVHWEMQLRRLNVNSTMWRITHVNECFRHIDSYPPFFVVPTLWADSAIVSACGNWSERRIPVWCWSSHNGSALIRSAHLDTSGEIGEKHWLHYEYAVSESHHMKQKPVILDSFGLGLKDISQAADLLRKLCSTDSAEIFWDMDVRWNAEVEKTGWLNLVAKSLSIVEHALSILIDQGKSVIIRESTNCDAACLLSCLVQICADGYWRTFEGFHILVQKEWCALSHPFAKRLFGVGVNKNRSLPDEETAPVFLLFLDCVHQLMEQNPGEFEFSHVYLVALWDLALSGACKSFLFNSPKEFTFYKKKIAHLRPAWIFSAFYKSEYVKIFKNPLYCFLNGFSLLEKSIVGRCPTLQLPLSSHVTDRLRPKNSPNNLTFWTDCFLRWTSPCQILRGGGVQRHLELLNVCAEITDLLKEYVKRTYQDNALYSTQRQTIRRFGVSHLFNQNLHNSGSFENSDADPNPKNPGGQSRMPFSNPSRFLERTTSGFPFSYETLPVPELLYAIPVRTECQQGTPAFNPRSALELSTLSEINTDIRRLSMAKLCPNATAYSNQSKHSRSNPSSPRSHVRSQSQKSAPATSQQQRRLADRPVPLAESESENDSDSTNQNTSLVSNQPDPLANQNTSQLSSYPDAKTLTNTDGTVLFRRAFKIVDQSNASVDPLTNQASNETTVAPSFDRPPLMNQLLNEMRGSSKFRNLHSRGRGSVSNLNVLTNKKTERCFDTPV